MRKTTLSEGKPRRIKRCEYSVLLMYTGESEDLLFFLFCGNGKPQGRKPPREKPNG